MGSVLIVVMVVCLGLVSLTLVFGRSMLMAYRGSDNNQSGQQAEQAIEGGARYAEYLMTLVSRPGATPDPTTFQSAALPIGDATFWFLGAPSSSDLLDTPVFGLIDEASKLNLNTASATMLQGLPGMTEDLAASIVAWRTSGTSSGGAFIQSSTTKNAPFESMEELALVSGTSGALLYGQDSNLNHVLDSNESAAGSTLTTGNTGSIIDSGLLEYVTVFSREPNTRSDGTARINITQPVTPALITVLETAFDRPRAQEIGARIRAAGPLRSVLQFYIRSGMTEAEFDKVSGDITDKNGNFATGRVNVNTASQTVLACIPGIGTDKAAQLIAARTNQSTAPANLLWVIPVLGEAGAIAAGPYLTANSYQISADVAAVGRNGRGYRRTRFVIDTSAGTPRIVYRRNLNALGWALGSEVRDSLATKNGTHQ